jgi:hypothetical protein
MTRRGGIGFGGADPLAAARSGDTGNAHVSGDLIAPDVVASTATSTPFCLCG